MQKEWRTLQLTLLQLPLPLHCLKKKCFNAISLDGMGLIEMKICSVCQYDLLSTECGKLKKNIPQNML